MTEPLLSVIYLTYRPGGIDLLAMAMACQLPYYELIVVDDFPGRPERGEAQKHLLSRGVRLGWYGASKPKNFPTPIGLANAMNTGALHARADKLVFIHDFTYPSPDDVDLWLRSFEEHGSKCLVSGTAQVWESDAPTQEGDISVWNHPNPLACVREPHFMWTPEVFENFYFGVPLNFLRLTNGFEEQADEYITWPVEATVAQAAIHQYRLAVDRRLQTWMVNHRSWVKQNPTQWHAEKQYRGEPPQTPGWHKISANPYDFTALRLQTLAEDKK